MFPSKENVGCFYCEWNGRKDKLASHSSVHHPGLKVQVKIAPNALSTFWKQQSVPPATEEMERSTNVHDTNDDSPTIRQVQLTATSPATTPTTTHSMPSPFSPPNDHQLQQQLSYMTEQLLNLGTKVDSLLVTKGSASTLKEVIEGEELDTMFNSIKISDDLYKLKNFEIDSQMELMTCLPCSKHKMHAPKQLQSIIKSSFGVFRSIEQDVGYNQTQKFRDLKKSIRSHLSNILHMWCMKEEQKERDEADDLLIKNVKAGFNIGRIALFSVCTGLGGLKFVETINLVDLCGGVVGNYR
jgi:hypothetical protein